MGDADGRTFARPTALRDGGERMHRRVLASLDLLPEYSIAVARFNAAPKSPELAVALDDLTSGVRAVLEWLGVDDELLAAFAAALEHADAHVVGFSDLPREVRSAVTGELARLVLEGGDLGADGQVVAERAIGVHHAERLQALLDEGGTLADWERLATDLAPLADRPAMAVAFVETVGPQALAEVPARLGRAWSDHAWEANWRGVDDVTAWEVLHTVSATLATASHTLGQPDGLSEEFLSRLFEVPATGGGPGQDVFPTVSDLGLLFTGGTFSDAALLELAAFAERALPAHGGFPPFDAESPWVPFHDPGLTILPAIAHSPVAAASQPRVLAQLVRLGELDADALDIAFSEAAVRAAIDDDYGERLAAEYVRLGMLPQEETGRFLVHLQAAGWALAGPGATLATLEGLRGRASEAGRNMHSRFASVRSDAARTLQATPSWLNPVTSSTAYRVGGRVLPAAGFGVLLASNLQQGQGTGEAWTRATAGAAGSWGGAKGAGALASPLLAVGPKGWVAYGGIVLVGGFAGGETADGLVGVLFDSDPAEHLWVGDLWRDGEPLPSPGPSGTVR